MTDSYIQAPPDSTGKKLDTAQLVIGANTVQRERVVLGDNTTAANYAVINASGQVAVTGPVTVASLPLPAGAATYAAQTDGSAKTTLVDEYNNEIEGTMLNQLKVAESHRLAGGIFNDGALDTNYFSATVSANGTVAVTNGEAILSTTTDANSSTQLTSVAVARYIGANSNYFRAILRLPDAGAVNNVRKWGATTGAAPTDGYYFQLSGTAFSIVTLLWNANRSGKWHI